MATLPIVNTADKRKGIIAALVVMGLILLYLLLVTFERADPPPQDIHVQLSEPMDITEIEDFTIEGGSGGGEPTDAPDRNVQQQTQQVITNQNSQTTTNSGQATTTNSNSENQQSANHQAPNPFGDGGFGGGSGGGEGTGMGQDSGTGGGTGSGNGTGAGRKRLSHVSMSGIQCNVSAVIKFKVVINSNGDVVNVYNTSGTTTSDQVLINRLMDAVKRTVKYSKSEGAPLIQKIYTFNVQPR